MRDGKREDAAEVFALCVLKWERRHSLSSIARLETIRTCWAIGEMTCAPLTACQKKSMPLPASQSSFTNLPTLDVAAIRNSSAALLV